MPDPRMKIVALIASLEELRLHMGKKDPVIGKHRVNAQLFFSLANACLRNRALLLYGGMGANKTTLVNLLGSSFLSLGPDEVENMMVTGHPKQTEEKMVGFLEFSATYPWTRPYWIASLPAFPPLSRISWQALPSRNGIWRSVIWQRVCRILHPSSSTSCLNA
jgi:MoxR-like ATPase